MKRFLLLLCYVACFVGVNRAGEATTDHFTVSDFQQDGDYYYFTVSLDGSRIYTAYNMDITLPEGVSPVIMDDIVQVYLLDGIYPTTGIGMNKKMQHSIGATWDVVDHQVLRLACTSNSNAELKATSGDLFMVYVNISPYTKAGENTMTFTMCNLIVKEGAKQYDPADETHTLTVGASRQLPLSISAANQWGTCVLPFSADVPSGVQAYSCADVSGDYLVLSPVQALAAYRPYILHAEQGYTGQLSGTADAADYTTLATDGLLHGAVVPQEITEGYVLQRLDGEVKFYNVDGQSFTIPEGRCWLAPTATSRPAFSFSGATTALQSAAAIPALPLSVYDLQGHRVSTPLPGHLYIIGGQKVLKFK